jgi:hypothetical protein
VTTQKLDASDPRFQQALDDFAAEHGMRIEDVLLPEHWHVGLVFGQPGVLVNSAGSRALIAATVHPDVVEEQQRRIAKMR